jgi:chromate transporter
LRTRADDDDEVSARDTSARTGALRDVAGAFLRLGLLGFGGPAAHIALMREELVRRRRWVSDRELLDLLAVANMLPGPNSTELAMHLGRERAGWRGLVIAGAAFIIPAALITGVLAWAYVTYGSLPEVRAVLHGVQPVMLAIVAQAVVSLSRAALTDGFRIALAIAVIAAASFGGNEIVLLFGGGLVMASLAAARARLRTVEPVSLLALFGIFLKIGAILYGSGYVLLAYLRADFVERTGWLTDVQLLDAIVAGQTTPGPVFSTATFIGYVLAGPAGAVVSTVAIFLPAFIFVALSGRLLARVKRSKMLAAGLDGLVVASLGLMAVVAVELARAAMVDALTVVLFALALAFSILTRVNAAWLIAAGAIAGIGASLVRPL